MSVGVILCLLWCGEVLYIFVTCVLRLIVSIFLHLLPTAAAGADAGSAGSAVAAATAPVPAAPA